MTAPSTRCLFCGASGRSSCRTSGDTPCRPHACRVFADRLPRGSGAAPRPSDGAELLAVFAGQLTLQEELLAGDELDAWRVASASVLLARVQIARARTTVRAILTRCPTPFKLALTPRSVGEELCRPLGLARPRWLALRRLAEHQLAGLPVETACARYGREAVSLFVARDLSFVPQDKVLRAARERLLSSAVLLHCRAALGVLARVAG